MKFHYLVKFSNILLIQEKILTWTRFETRSPALETGMLRTAPPRGITGAIHNFPLADPQYPPDWCWCQLFCNGKQAMLALF